MTMGAKRPRVNLRQGLDRDVYQILKKLEDTANDGRPFKTTTAVYDAIKRSNSSLSRQKKRPLEDSIDRVLQFRREELDGDDGSDSEAALDEAEPVKPEDDRFLLNRQMTKHWHRDPAPPPPPQASPQATEGRAVKKRRIQQGDGGDEAVAPAAAALTPAQSTGQADTDAPPTGKLEKVKKAPKPSRFQVEHPSGPIRLGGVSDMYSQLRKNIENPLKRPDIFVKQGRRKAPGIVVSGPPGIGKESLIRSLASDLEVPLVSLTGCLEDAERMERNLNDAIEEAMRIAPCIIYIDHLDWYMAKSGGNSHSDPPRVVTQFMRQMRRLQKEQPADRPVLAMATTSRITDVEPTVLKTGLFERTLQMKIPDLDARRDIFRVLTEGESLAESVDFVELAKLTHGFVGADIVNVLTIAQYAAVERTAERIGETQGDLEVQEVADSMDLGSEPPDASHEPGAFHEPLTQQDFLAAIKDFTPSLRKEGFTDIPNVTWAQVGALQDVREQLDMSIIGPIKEPEVYREVGLDRPAGCLLWGPPGCGKTLVAQAVANEAQASFILINGPELLNKYVGESERAVRELFNRARSSTPCILFFDEMDSLVPKRDSASTEASSRVVNALLTELDGAQDRSGVYVIGTTNRPDMIDPAMLRPGRLNVRLFVDMPQPDERVDILRAIYRTKHAGCGDDELEGLEKVARDERCDNFSGADLHGLHIKAAESTLKRWRRGDKTGRRIDDVDWEHALATTHRSVMNPESYRKLATKLGQST